jgi:hypothetical protein
VSSKKLAKWGDYMNGVNLTIRLTEEYRERVNKARESEALRKCRSWVDLLEPTDENIEVELNDVCIILKCNTGKGLRQDSCTYDGVLAVTEMQDGILLRLSHKRLLWLPTSRDAQNNNALMDAMMLLGIHCKYHFRTARLKLKGVGIVRKIAFHTRIRQGLYTGDFYVKVAITVFLCLVFFVATVFVSQVFRNQKIQRQEAITFCAEFEKADPAFGKSTVKYIDLEFKNAEEQTIDGCCLGHGLQEKLERLPSGTQMQLLIHPDSGNVLQIQVADEILLDFDFAQERIWNEALCFMGLGILMYAIGIFLTVGAIRKKL